MSQTRSLSLALAAATLAPAALTAQTPARWNADPAHSAVTFRVRHLGISWVNGAFGTWTAQITYDPARPEAASVTARIDARTVNTGNERRDNDLRTNYLTVDSFPEIVFESRKVEPAGAGRLRVAGDLTIRGVTRPAVLDVEVAGVITTRRGQRTAFIATTSVRRQDFGVTLNNLMEGIQVVGDEVRITIDIEAIAAASP